MVLGKLVFALGGKVTIIAFDKTIVDFDFGVGVKFENLIESLFGAGEAGAVGDVDAMVFENLGGDFGFVDSGLGEFRIDAAGKDMALVIVGF